MCTKGSVGQVSADTIGRYGGRHSVDTRPSIGRVSVECRPTLSADTWPSIDRVSVDYRPTYRSILGRWYIGQLSVAYRSTVGGISV